jgi:hypothetical protein
LRWLSRHQIPVLVVLLVVMTWGALWVVYDYRSPVSQFLRGVGTVQLEGWSAYDLDTQCVRLEEADGTPTATAESAGQVARKSYPTGYVREIVLVSYRDTCSGAAPRLAWAVAMAWPVTANLVGPTGASPRAMVVVDAKSGKLIVSHAEGQG